MSHHPMTARAGSTPVWFEPGPRQSASCHADKHGTDTAYLQGCRCPSAREQYRLYRKRRREGRAEARIVDATGTTRRLQALAALGWSTKQLADQVGWRDANSVRNLMRPEVTRVNARTAQAVQELYDKLSMTPGPSDRARGHARRQHWPPPLAWSDEDLDNPAAEVDPQATQPPVRRDSTDIDHVVVELACRGELPADQATTSAERELVITQLHARGLSDVDIGRRLHLSDRQIQRIRPTLTPAADNGHPDEPARDDLPATAQTAAATPAQVAAKVQRAREAVAANRANRTRPGSNGATRRPQTTRTSIDRNERSPLCLT